MRKELIALAAIAAFGFGTTAAAQTAPQRAKDDQSPQQQARPASPSRQNQQTGTAQGSAGVTASGATSASANTSSNSASISSGTIVDADLLTTADARKSHVGQRVVAKTTRDIKEGRHIVLRKGTRLVGHVTEAEAKTKANARSVLGIAFDEAIEKNGQSIPFHATIQALAESQSAASLANDDMMDSADPMGSAPVMASGGSARGGLLAGAGATVGGATGAAGGVAGGMAGGVAQTAGGAAGGVSAAAGSAVGRSGGLDAAGRLTSNSSGVFGLRGLSLASATGSSAQGSVIASSVRSVHLSSGTQMLLRVTRQ